MRPGRTPATSVALRTGGCLIRLDSELSTAGPALVEAAGGPGAAPEPVTDTPDVHIVLERTREPFDAAGMFPVTRGVWTDAAGNTVVEDAGGSGFAQHWSVGERQVTVHARWAPSPAARGAAHAMPARFRALRAQVLLHYPVMWWGLLTADLAPMHVSALTCDGLDIVLAGPGGVGKSTLVAHELARGGTAACDNLALSDGRQVHGLSEPLRLSRSPGEREPGRRTTHGRSERPWTRRDVALTPQVLVVVRRGLPDPGVGQIPEQEAMRALVAGTYAAGELRRYWPLVAHLALATGRTPAHPPVDRVAADLARRLPCLELRLGDRPPSDLGRALRAALHDLAHGAAR